MQEIGVVICQAFVGHCVFRKYFFAVVGRSWSFVGRLLFFLDGLHRVRGWALFTVTWGRRGGKADAGCHWAMCWGCGWSCWRGSGWLKKKEDTSQGCDTVASHSTHTWDQQTWHLLFGHISNKCYWELVFQTIHSHPSDPSHVFDRKIDRIDA